LHKGNLISSEDRGEDTFIPHECQQLFQYQHFFATIEPFRSSVDLILSHNGVVRRIIEKLQIRRRSLDYIWAPWRMEYVLKEKKNGCVFCEEIQREDGFENLIIHRAQYSFVILNRYPYTSGHMMVVPYLHKANLEDLTAEIRSEMIELSSRVIQVLRKAYQPQGFNLGINMGEVAGAGVLDHVHLHVLPRWGGDTSFLSSLAETRVLPELLRETYTRVSKAWKENE